MVVHTSEINLALLGCRFIMITNLFSDTAKGINTLWILEDNFVAGTYRLHFKKRGKDDYFLKTNFEVKTYCSSKFNNSNVSYFSRLQNTLAAAINKNELLPKFMIVVLDDDLIQYLDFKTQGQATMYGGCLEWLLKSFYEDVQQKKEYLPTKAKRLNLPMIYWVEIPNSKHFSHDVYDSRVKFNLTLHSVVKQYVNMRVIKLKDWCTDSFDVICHNDFTSIGLDKYWDVIDKTFQFNVTKRDEFLVKEAAKNFAKKTGHSRAVGGHPGDMHKFFNRHNDHGDNFNKMINFIGQKAQ